MNFKVVLLGIGALPAVFAAPLFSHAQEDKQVVAVVNGSELKKADFNQEFWKLLPENRSFHGKVAADKMEKIRTEALQKLVDTELQYQDAKAKGMVLSANECKEEIEKISSRYKGKKNFKSLIAESGFDEKSFSLLVERTKLAERIRVVEVDNKVEVADSAVKAYYDKNAERYSKPQEYRASQILIKVDPAASEEERLQSRKKAEKILNKLKEGAVFADIAAQESDDMTRIKGGDLGYFHAGQTVEQFDGALAKMKVGETSDLVESIYGYHIIQLTDKRPPRQIPFEELRSKIKAELIANEKKRLMDQWMSGLRSKAVITYPGEK